MKCVKGRSTVICNLFIWFKTKISVYRGVCVKRNREEEGEKDKIDVITCTFGESG